MLVSAPYSHFLTLSWQPPLSSFLSRVLSPPLISTVFKYLNRTSRGFRSRFQALIETWASFWGIVNVFQARCVLVFDELLTYYTGYLSGCSVQFLVVAVQWVISNLAIVLVHSIIIFLGYSFLFPLQRIDNLLIVSSIIRHSCRFVSGGIFPVSALLSYRGKFS